MNIGQGLLQGFRRFSHLLNRNRVLTQSSGSTNKQTVISDITEKAAIPVYIFSSTWEKPGQIPSAPLLKEPVRPTTCLVVSLGREKDDYLAISLDCPTCVGGGETPKAASEDFHQLVLSWEAIKSLCKDPD